MYVCDVCGAHLDPGEKCDCNEQARKPEEQFVNVAGRSKFMVKEGKKDGSLRLSRSPRRNKKPNK